MLRKHRWRLIDSLYIHVVINLYDVVVAFDYIDQFHDLFKGIVIDLFSIVWNPFKTRFFWSDIQFFQLGLNRTEVFFGTGNDEEIHLQDRPLQHPHQSFPA